MKHIVRFASLLLFLSLGSSILNGQSATGTPPLASLGGGPEVIDLSNLNAQFVIPVVHRPGRAGSDFSYAITFDTSIWYLATSGSFEIWEPVPGLGWNSGSGSSPGYITYASQVTATCSNPFAQNFMYYNWVYHDGTNTPHPMNIVTSYTSSICNGNGIPTSETKTATDGSGYTMSVTGSTVNSLTRMDGATIQAPVGTTAPSGIGLGSITDRNGNQTSVNTGVFTDTLGTTVLTVAGSGTAASPNTFSYTAPSGGTAKFTMNYTNYTVATNFGASGISEYKSSAPVPLVSSIVLPDGSQYIFTYEATPSVPSSGACTAYSGTTCTTARLASVTLPTGGTISYTYTGGSNGILSDGSAATLTRTTPDGSWTYAQVKGTGAASTTTVTDPQGNQSVIQFQGIYETQHQIFQGSASSGTLLTTTNTCYNGSASPCNSTAVAMPITGRSVVTTLPGSSNLVAKHSDSLNVYGLPTETDDYDYGSGAPGALLGKIVYTYASLGNITAFRQQVTVQNGSGTTVSQTNYNYDETPVTATSGTPQHTSVTGSRGNLTSISYPVSGLTSHFTYYDTGTQNTATNVNGAVTTYNYSSNSCGNSFPTSVSESLGLSRSMTWSCTGGVQTSVTDENSKTVTYTFNDAGFWRINAITDPLNNVTSYTYQPNPSNAAPPLVAWSMTFNNGSSVSSDLQYKDSLGRTYVDQRSQGPNASTLDSVSYTFDSNGRPYSISMPCAISWKGTCSTPKTTQTYDAQNRPFTTTDGGLGTITKTYPQNDVLVTQGPAPTGEKAKSRQLEYDGLGRLTSVCEITSASGSGACVQNAAQTGFWTKYAYDALNNLTSVTQNAQSTNQQTRSYTSDAMKRLTSETNPESGTTSYTYDTDSTCGTSKGDLVKKVDAVGNITCYSYDALHRLLSKTYPSGSYASVTPSKFFVYDSATVNGVAMANAKGRLAEAYTCMGSCTSKITDEGFSYTARGELSDQYQSSPNSGGYYHANYLYWANGAMQQVSGLPSLPTFTYGVDPEGRINTLSASTGQNPLTGTTYSSASLPTGLAFGSGDSDAYSYDSNTNRMTQYKFNVNGQAFVGNLHWNANGTLGSLGITDPFNSADTQNCAYSHDDLTRIASVNCGATWTQTFSYDAFGNISKSGSMMFQPTYNVATNRMTSIGTFAPTYDANGNVLNNSAHTYTWDAEGKYVSVDGVAVIYDALGRAVDFAFPLEILYLPDGSQMMFRGQSAIRAYLGFPGGSQVVYDSAGLLNYIHADNLGSYRLVSTPARTFSSSVAYAPFGELYPSTSGVTAGFTGQHQEIAFDEFDFPARQYSNQGRWVSPDPAGLAAVDPANPQSWNRYAYVLDRPTTLRDKTGLYPGLGFRNWFRLNYGLGVSGDYFLFYDGGDAFPYGGYDIFDAILGAPGTFVSYNIYGQMSFGFSLDLYQTETAIADQTVNSSGGTTEQISLYGNNWRVNVTNLGTDTVSSGFIIDLAHASDDLFQSVWNSMSGRLRTAYLQDLGNGLSPLDAMTSVLALAAIIDPVWHDGTVDAIANFHQSSANILSNYQVQVTFGYQPYICNNGFCVQPNP